MATVLLLYRGLPVLLVSPDRKAGVEAELVVVVVVVVLVAAAAMAHQVAQAVSVLVAAVDAGGLLRLRYAPQPLQRALQDQERQAELEAQREAQALLVAVAELEVREETAEALEERVPQLVMPLSPYCILAVVAVAVEMAHPALPAVREDHQYRLLALQLAVAVGEELVVVFHLPQVVVLVRTARKTFPVRP